jgi:hypothetical protein
MACLFRSMTPDDELRAGFNGMGSNNTKLICASLQGSREPPPRGYARWDVESLREFLRVDPRRDER